VAAGAAATGVGVALLAVSGFLLARASQHPAIIGISVAVVAVRALSIGRGVSRYLERLASHDVPIVLIGSERVSQFVFYGLGDRLIGNTFYFWEDFLEGSFAAPAYRLAQDRPQWQ